MKPAARIQAVIELLDALHESLASAGPSFARLFRRYFKRRRYAGAGDRREIKRITYDILRDYQRLAWSLEKAGAPVSGRTLALAFSVGTGGEPGALFSGGKYAPRALNSSETRWAAALADLPRPPEWARGNCPQWLYPSLEARFGSSVGPALEALNAQGPVTLRVNRLICGPEDAAAKLADEGIAATAGRWLGDCLVAPADSRISSSAAYRDGLVEIQDEGAQIAARLVAAAPGTTVVDFCAGAGGKSLALAADMENGGLILAGDRDAGRLRELERRAERSGVRNLEIVGRAGLDHTTPEADRVWFRHAMSAARVLVDAPCSGTGIWRRQPELRLRYDQEGLERLTDLQARLLDASTLLVAPGGRLVYVTCSLLKAENEDQCAAFLDRRPGWRRLDWGALWDSLELGPPPESLAHDEHYLQLAPHAHGTDGLFIAIFEAPGGLRQA